MLSLGTQPPIAVLAHEVVVRRIGGKDLLDLLHMSPAWVRQRLIMLLQKTTTLVIA
jgi:hypothetical protein